MRVPTVLPRVVSLAAAFGVMGSLSAEMTSLKYRTLRDWDVVLPKEQFSRSYESDWRRFGRGS
jgi:predicted outer membrane lipoprotein